MIRAALIAVSVPVLLPLFGCARGYPVPPGDFTTRFTAINARAFDDADRGPVRISATATLLPGVHDRTPTRAKQWIRIDRVWTSDGALVVDSPGPDWGRFVENLSHSSMFRDPGEPFRLAHALGSRSGLPASALSVGRIAGEVVRFEAARVLKRRVRVGRLLDAEEFEQIAPGVWLTARDPRPTDDGTDITIRIWTSPTHVPPPHGPDAMVAMDPDNYSDDALTDADMSRLDWALPRVAGIDVTDDRGAVVFSQDILSVGSYTRDGSIDEDTWSIPLQEGRSLAYLDLRVVLEQRIVREPFDVTIDDVLEYRRTLPRPPRDD